MHPVLTATVKATWTCRQAGSMRVDHGRSVALPAPGWNRTYEAAEWRTGHAGRWSQERNQQMLAELTALRSRFHHDDVVAVASAAKSQVRACVGRWERLPFG